MTREFPTFWSPRLSHLVIPLYIWNHPTRASCKRVHRRQMTVGTKCLKMPLFCPHTCWQLSWVQNAGLEITFPQNLKAWLFHLLVSNVAAENSDVIPSVGSSYVPCILLSVEGFQVLSLSLCSKISKWHTMGMGLFSFFVLETSQALSMQKQLSFHAGEFSPITLKTSFPLLCLFCLSGTPISHILDLLYQASTFLIFSLPFSHLFVSIFWKTQLYLPTFLTLLLNIFIFAIILSISNRSFFFSKYLFCQSLI